MTVFVTLTEVEKSWVVQWATAIYEASKEQNLVDVKMDASADSLQMDIVGFGGELAFAKMANQFPLTDTDGPTRVDCVINGKSVDIKTTNLENGRLLVRPAHKLKPADAYVLITGSMDEGYTYRGWATAEQIFADENLTDLGHGPTYALTQGELRGGLPE